MNFAWLNLIILKLALYNSITTEKNDLQTRQWQLNNGLDVTHWIRYPLRNHFYLCQVHELHFSNSILKMMCFQSLPQNHCIMLTDLALHKNYVVATDVRRCSGNESKTAIFQKNNQLSNKWATPNMTFGDSSLWYIFAHTS